MCPVIQPILGSMECVWPSVLFLSGGYPVHRTDETENDIFLVYNVAKDKTGMTLSGSGQEAGRGKVVALGY